MAQERIDTPGKANDGLVAATEPPSVLRMINTAHRQLEHVLFNLAGEADVQSRILDIARTLTEATDSNPDIALACILLNQDEGSYAVRHCIDSAVVALLVARALGQVPSETLTLMAAALTMNVGMLPSQEQLQSRLNAISDAELAFIHRHPQQSVDMLRAAGVSDEEWLSYVLLHHENEDGSGYPQGKKGDEIPLNAKIIALADRYCARVSSRSYRKSLLPNEALSDILLADHHSVDPMLTTCFIRVLGIYPTGAVVRLANGEIGVVAGAGSSSTTPIVHALIAPDGGPLMPPQRRDTGRAPYAVREMLSEERAGVRFSMQQVWGDEARP
ncbi:MAG TPA: HD domain-containing phosphohydrolase [Noviherbaspirillum sp.]